MKAHGSWHIGNTQQISAEFCSGLFLPLKVIRNILNISENLTVGKDWSDVYVLQCTSQVRKNELSTKMSTGELKSVFF